METCWGASAKPRGDRSWWPSNLSTIGRCCAGPRPWATALGHGMFEYHLWTRPRTLRGLSLLQAVTLRAPLEPRNIVFGRLAREAAPSHQVPSSPHASNPFSPVWALTSLVVFWGEKEPKRIFSPNICVGCVCVWVCHGDFPTHTVALRTSRWVRRSTKPTAPGGH